MKWSDLEKIGEAPSAGQMLAYTRKSVIFQDYGDIGEVEQKVSGAELLEIHLFDDNKEYRAVSTRSKRFKDGVIETVADFCETQEETYKEVVLLEDGQKTMTVLNHLFYDNEGPDATGMAVIDNYRLKMGGQSNVKVQLYKSL